MIIITLFGNVKQELGRLPGFYGLNLSSGGSLTAVICSKRSVLLTRIDSINLYLSDRYLVNRSANFSCNRLESISPPWLVTSSSLLKTT